DTPGSPSPDSNRAVQYVYDLPGHKLTRQTLLPGGSQDTEFKFEARTATGSKLDSNELLTEVSYPNRSSGAASTFTYDKRFFTYNGVGQPLRMTDRSGVAHDYTYDVVGRLTEDAVTIPGG